MATSQTSVQNQDDILLESAKLEYSTDKGNTFTNLGLADDIAITFSSTARDVNPGNGPTPSVAKGSASQSAQLTASLWELSIKALSDLTGGLFTRTTVAGTEETDRTQELDADTQEDGGFLAFDEQMYDGSSPSSISVADTANTYVLNTDYRVIKVNDIWGVQWIAGTSFDPTLVITITYTVTPSSSESATVGGTSTQSEVYFRVTQKILRTDVDYDVYNIWDLYKGFQSGDLAASLKNKDDTDPVARIPLTMDFSLDEDRDAGDQLYKFTRQQVKH
jgi:hypothetical protein